MLVFLPSPALAAEALPGTEQFKRDQQNRKTISDLINKVRLLTRENTRVTDLAETYKAQITTLELENKRLQSRVDELEKELTSGSSADEIFVEFEKDVESLVKELGDTHYNLGVVYQEQGRYAEAEMEYKKALSFNPDDGDTLFNLGFIHAKVKNNKSVARYYYQRYLEVNPDAPDRQQVRKLMLSL